MIDFEKIRTIYKFGRNLSLSDAQVLLKATKKTSFASGKHLIQEGSTRQEVFFITKGVVRAFAINKKGDEITTRLMAENQLVANGDTILFNQPARFYFEALEPVEAFSISYDLLQTIVDENPKLGVNRKFFFQTILKQAIHRIDSFVLLSPEERYIEYVKSNPEMVNRVPGKYIANVLGITPVSLSRIRNRIAARKKQ